jgi:hypothetical protein
VNALVEGIADGTPSILCSDYAPHADFEKEVELDAAHLASWFERIGLFIDSSCTASQDRHRPVDRDTLSNWRLLKVATGTLSIGAG